MSQDNLTDKLSKSLADNVFDTNQQTSARIPNLSVLQGFIPQNDVQQEQEKDMLSGLGKALSNTKDFSREAAEHFIDTALFSAPSAFTDWSPGDDVENLAEKIGAGVGGTAGFISPWKATAKVLGKVTKMGSGALGKVTTDTMTKSLDDVIRVATTGSKTGKVVQTTKAGDDVLRWSPWAKESENIADTFRKSITKIYEKQLGRFGHLGVKQKADFGEMIEQGMGLEVKRIAASQGIEMSDDVVKAISGKMQKIWKQADGHPIDGIQSIIAKAFPTNKMASFFSHTFEEGVTFATVDSIMHGMQVLGDKTDANFGEVASHGLILGNALGVTRFLPNMGFGQASTRGGFGSLFQADGRANWKALIFNSKNYAKKLDPKNPEHQLSLKAMYKTFDDLAETDHAGSAAAGQLSTFMQEWYGLARNKKFDFGSPTFGNLNIILETGTPAQKQNVAEAMQAAVSQVASQTRREWRKPFLQEWAKDFAGATPRMGLGGLVMGNTVIFDENIPLEDKILTVGIGAFLMRSGKDLQYRGRDGSYKVKGELRAFPNKLKELKELSDSVGHKFELMDASTGTWNIDPMWRNLMAISETANTSNPESKQKLSDLEETKPILNVLNTSAKRASKDRINSDIAEVEAEIKIVEKELKELEDNVPPVTIGDRDYTIETAGKKRESDLQQIGESKQAQRKRELLNQKENLLIDKQKTEPLSNIKIFTTGADAKIQNKEVKVVINKDGSTTTSTPPQYQKPGVKKNIVDAWNEIIDKFSKKEILGVDSKGKTNRLKRIQEMTRKEYETLESMLEANNIKNVKDVRQIFVKSNKKNIQNGVQHQLKTALDFIDSFRDGNGDPIIALEYETIGGERKYTFRTINYGQISRQLTDAQKNAFDEFNGLLMIMKDTGKHTVLSDTKRIELTGKNVNANFDGVVKTMELSIEKLQKDMNIEMLDKSLSWKDSWLREVLEFSNVERQIDHTTTVFEKAFEDTTSPLGTLLSAMFKGSVEGKSDGPIAEVIGIELTRAEMAALWKENKKFDILGGNKSDRAFLEQVKEIVNKLEESTDASPKPFAAKTVSTVSKQQINKLRELFYLQNVHVFNGKQRFSTPKFAKAIAHEILMNKFRNGKKRDGTNITEADLAIVEKLIQRGLVTNNLTLRPVGRMLYNMFDNNSPFSKSENILDIAKDIQKKIDNKEMSVEEGASAMETFKSIKDVLTDEIGVFGLQSFKEIKAIYDEVVLPLVVDNKGQGILHTSSIETASMGRGEFALLTNSLMEIKNGRFVSDTSEFFSSLKENTFSGYGVAGKNKNKILQLLLTTSSYDPARAYLLAREYNIWDAKSGQLTFERDGIPDGTLKETLKRLQVETQSNHTTDFLDTINQRVLQLEDMAKDRTTSDTKPVQFNAWSSGYSLKGTKFEQGIEAVIGDKKTESDRLFSIYNKDYIGKNKTTADFMKDLETAFVKANPTSNIKEIQQNISKWIVDKINNERIMEIQINEIAPNLSTFKERIVKKSLAMEQIQAAQLGIDGSFGKPMVILSADNHLFLEGERGRYGDLKSNTHVGTLTELLLKLDLGDTLGGKFSANNSTNKFGKLGALSVINHEMFLYRYGSTDYMFGIDASGANLNGIASNWVKMLAKQALSKKDNLSMGDFAAKLNNYGKDFGEIIVEKYNNKTNSWEITEPTPENITKNKVRISMKEVLGRNIPDRMKEIMDDLTFGKIIPDTYWSGKLWKATDTAFINMMKRSPITSNISANRYTSNLISDLAAGWTKSDANLFKQPKDAKDRDRRREVIDFMDSFSRGEQKIVIVQDEVASGIADMYSNNKKQIAQAEKRKINAQKAIDALDTTANMPKEKKIELKEIYEKRIEAIDLEIIKINKTPDASTYNGVTYTRDDGAFQALSALGGEFNSRDVGGIKPVVHGMDSRGNSFLIKTAFVKDVKLKEFFDNNPTVMAVTFTSSLKKTGADYTQGMKDRLITAEEFNEGKGRDFSSNKLITLRPEHIAISAVKGPKSKASLTIGNSNHIYDKTAKGDYFEEYFRVPLDEMRNDFADLASVGNMNQQIAMAKQILGNQITEKGEYLDLSEGQLGVMDAWLGVGGHPLMFENGYLNGLKAHYIDKALKPKINGGQSVLVPDTKSELKNTLVLDGKIFDYGETYLSRQEASKTANIERITIKESKTNSEDVIFNLNNNSALKNDFLIFADAKGKRQKNLTLGDFVEWAKTHGDKYQILTAVERIPHTKSSSVMLVGIKDFKDGLDGNEMALNNADVKRAAEGDYDIDTVNVFWESPHSVIKEYARGRTEVQDSFPLPFDSSSSGANGLSFSDFNSQTTYMSRLKEADMVKGAAMNASRQLQSLLSMKGDSNYEAIKTDSAFRDTNFITDVKNEIYQPNLVVKVSQQTFAVLREGKELDVVNQKIADYIQSALDASGGFNRNKITVKNMRKAIFFGDQGAFKLMSLQSVAVKGGSAKKVLVETGKTVENSRMMEKILNHLMDPYKDLLKLTNKIYQDGHQSKNVDWKSMMTGISRVNSRLWGLDSKATRDDLKLTEAENNLLGKDALYFGLGKNSQIASGNIDNTLLPIYDRVLANIMHMKNISMNKDLKIKHSDAYTESFQTIQGSSDMQTAYKELGKELVDSYEKTQFLNYVQKKVNDLYEYRAKFKDYKTRENILKYDIKPLERKLHDLKNEISLELRDYAITGNAARDIKTKDYQKNSREQSSKNKKNHPDNWKKNQKIVDDIINHYYVRLLKDKQKQVGSGILDKATKTNLKREAIEMFKKEPFKIETEVDANFIKYTAINDVFGSVAAQIHTELGMSQGEFVRLNQQLKEVEINFAKGVGDLMHEHQREISWEHVYENTMQQLDGVMREFENQFHTTEQAKQFIFARLATPGHEKNSWVQYRGKFYQAPKKKGADKYINLAFRWYMRQSHIGNGKQTAASSATTDAFMRKVADRFNVTLMQFHGRKASPRGDILKELGNNEHFYYNPFEYSRTELRQQLMKQLLPEATGHLGSEFSRLDVYHQVNEVLGSGLLQDVIISEAHLNLPYMMKTALNNSYHKVESPADINRGEELGGGAMITREGFNDMFNDPYTLDAAEAGHAYWNEHKNVTDFVSSEIKKRSMENC